MQNDCLVRIVVLQVQIHNRNIELLMRLMQEQQLLQREILNQ